MVARAYSPSVQEVETEDHQSKIKFGGTLSQLTDKHKKENKTKKPKKYERDLFCCVCFVYSVWHCLLTYKLIMIKGKSCNTIAIV